MPSAAVAPAFLGGEDSGLRPELPLGWTDVGRLIGPPVEAHEGRHLAVIGETGMGKSSTLLAVARQAARLGGVILLDPLGDTAGLFAESLSDTDRKRLLWISPSHDTSSINALASFRPSGPEKLATGRGTDELVGALRRVRLQHYSSGGFWGPRLEEMLSRTLRAASAIPGGTLVDAYRLLDDGRGVRRVVPPEAQEPLGALLERLRSRPDDAEGARRVLYEVVRSPTLVRLLCSDDPDFSTDSLVAPGRLTVISGDASSAGEATSRYLLSVYLAIIWYELLARPGTPKTFVVLDEAQWYSHESLSEMLRMARRRNVHVILATQALASLPEDVAEAAWTNVSDFLVYRGSPEEAREISRTAPGVSPEELLSLPRGRAAALLGKGHSVHWIRTAGRPTSDFVVDGRDAIRTTLDGGSAPLPTSQPPDGGDLHERLLAWLRDRARTVPAGAALSVDLAELRRLVDPSGEAIRRLGGVLGRSGALTARRKVAGGTRWVLDAARIPLPAAGGAPAEPGSAEDAQPS